MILKDISFHDPQENILYDEMLLDMAEKQEADEVLRFWESPTPFVVLGRIGKVEEEVKTEAVRQDQIAIVRRCSGGGTVVQGQGCLNYSLILSKEKNPQIRNIRQSYQWILGKIIEALGKIDVETIFQPISDIALTENLKKISGNAQRRSRKYILHHGTILNDFDLALAERYLKMPQQYPPYREGRTHVDFLANINKTMGEIKKSIIESFIVNEKNSFSLAQEGHLVR